jgi:hypothetical protein
LASTSFPTLLAHSHYVVFVKITAIEGPAKIHCEQLRRLPSSTTIVTPSSITGLMAVTPWAHIDVPVMFALLFERCMAQDSDEAR